MSAIKFYSVNPTGPMPLPLTGKETTIHSPFDNLPMGVYTAFATFAHNKFLGLKDHLDRLENSAALSGWSYNLDRPALRRALHQVCTDYPEPNSRVRLNILPRSAPELGTKDRTMIALAPFWPIPREIYEQGVSVAVVRRSIRKDPLIKKAEFVLWRRQLLENYPSVYECLLAYEGGQILEGTTSNFYAVRQGVVWTAGTGILEGVARKIVLKMVNQLEIGLIMQPVTLDELPELEEAFVSSSSRAIIPIVRIDDQTIGQGRPGPITKKLLVNYNAFVAGQIRTAI